MKNIVDKINEHSLNEGFFDNTGVTKATDDKKKALDIEKMLCLTFIKDSREKGRGDWQPIKPIGNLHNKRFCDYLRLNFRKYEGFEVDIIYDADKVEHFKFIKSFASPYRESWEVYNKTYGFQVYEDYGLCSFFERGPIVKGSVKLAYDD